MTISRLKCINPFIISFLILFAHSLYSDKFPFPGEKPSDPGFHAFVGGDIQVSPDLRIKNGILLVRDGKVESVAKNLKIPSFYREWNCSGRTIYPGFIDPYLLAECTVRYPEKFPCLVQGGQM